MSIFQQESRIVTLACPKHGEYTGEAVKLNIFRREKEMNPTCPACEREIAAEKACEEEEHRKWRAINRLRSMNIEPRLRGEL